MPESAGGPSPSAIDTVEAIKDPLLFYLGNADAGLR